MLGDRRARRRGDLVRCRFPPAFPFGDGPALRQIAIGRIVRRRLIGHHIRTHAATHQFRQHLGRVAQQPDRHRLAFAARPFDHRQRLVQRRGAHVEIAGLQPHLDPAGLAFDREQRCAGHRRGQRLRAAHAAQAGGQDPAPGEAAAVVAPPDLDERFIRALDDSLTADIDPRARRHLAEHHQPLAVEFVEMLPGRPMRHQVRIRDQHARRVRMRAEHADRLARLHQQRLVRLQPAQRRDDAVVAVPVARRAADAAIDDQLARALRHLGIEVVHQHAQRRFGEPRLRGDRPCRAARARCGRC